MDEVPVTEVLHSSSNLQTHVQQQFLYRLHLQRRRAERDDKPHSISTLALQHARTTAHSHYSMLALQHTHTIYSTLALQHARTTAHSHYSTFALQHTRTTAHSHYSTLALKHTRTTAHLHSQAQHCWAEHCSPHSCAGKNSNSHWPCINGMTMEGPDCPSMTTPRRRSTLWWLNCCMITISSIILSTSVSEKNPACGETLYRVWSANHRETFIRPIEHFCM